MPEGGKLKIGVREILENDQRKVLLRVEDSGQGIPEEYRKKVFDPFFTTKEKGKLKTCVSLPFFVQVEQIRHADDRTSAILDEL
jgi:K+-sensing histidine kinase KdpD